MATVKVPEQFEQIFARAQEAVARYFSARAEEPEKGCIEIAGERYILVRAASMAVDFFSTIVELYQEEGKEEAQNIARQLLFDIAHAIGKQDARNFHDKMKLSDPVDRLSAGPVHFAHTGWAFVDILPESRPSPDEDFYLIYDHPYSFESASWLAAGIKTDFPVCVMNAGYSSGWCEESFGVQLVASEVTCQAMGEEACRFIMGHPSRMQGYIEQYLQQHELPLNTISRFEVPGFFKRKVMEEALRKSEASLVDAQRMAHIGSWDLDLCNNRLNWSAEIFRIFELDSQTFSGSYEAFLDLVHPDDRGLVETAFNESVSKRLPYDIVHRLLMPDGRVKYVNERCQTFYDAEGRPLRSVGTVQDITAQQQTELSLLESETRLKSILESLHAGIMIIDPQSHRIVEVNRAAAEMIGAGKEQIIGAQCHRYVCPAEKGKCPVTDLKQTVDNSERELLTANGGSLPILKTVATVMLDGRPHLLESFVDISQQKAHERKVHSLNTLLLTIRRINEHLLVATSEEELFHFVCNALVELECITGCYIGLKQADHTVSIPAYTGFDAQIVTALNIRWDDSLGGQGTLGSAIRSGKPKVDAELLGDQRHTPWLTVIREMGLRSAAAVPLVADGDVIGALAVYSKTPGAFDDESVRFLAEVAGDIAIGVRTLRLNARLNATLNSLRRSLYGSISAIAGMVELRDPYTAGHEKRVGMLAAAIGQELGLPERQIEGLRVTGSIHDIGKIVVPAEILSKPTRLSVHEFAIIKEHSQTGFELLKELDFPWPVAEAVLQHHERLDGSGYPRGLRGEEIILEARILMVADVVESMAGHRPYRPALGIDKALDEITSHQGKFYDESVVEACVRLFTEKGFVLEQG
jgi:PAS domain S-box-containing protein